MSSASGSSSGAGPGPVSDSPSGRSGTPPLRAMHTLKLNAFCPGSGAAFPFDP